MIRVGRCTYDKQGKISYPTYDGYTPVVVMMMSHSKYYPLSPYLLQNEHGHLMENIWQYSKIYPSIAASKQYYSRYNKTVIWDHPKEDHFTDGKPTEAYWAWRKKGFNNKYPVRYPVGFTHRHECIGSIPEYDHSIMLDYIQARKKIYIPVYCEMVKNAKYFAELQTRLSNGENLLIIEVDGPHQESLEYYQEMYHVDNDFIEDDSILITSENLTVLVNDDKHAFGHGYCLAMALLDMDEDTLVFWDQIDL